MAKVCP